MTKGEERDVIIEMAKDSGKDWAELCDRSKLEDGVRVSFEPLTGYILTIPPRKKHRDWLVTPVRFTEDEVAGFFAAFGTHWKLLLGAHVAVGPSAEPWKIRAFVANARRRGRGSWSVSLGRVVKEPDSPLAT